MFYEGITKRHQMNGKGLDVVVTEKWLVENVEFFAEAEVKLLEEWNNECDVIALKQSKLREMINERGDEDDEIYFSTIENILIDEISGEEKATQYVVGLFAKSLEEATRETLKYMQMGITDMNLVKVQRTKIVEVLK